MLLGHNLKLKTIKLILHDMHAQHLAILYLYLIKFIFLNMFSPCMNDFMNILVCKNVVLYYV